MLWEQRRRRKRHPIWMCQRIHKGTPLSHFILTAVLQGRYYKWQLALSVRVETGTGMERRLKAIRFQMLGSNCE